MESLPIVFVALAGLAALAMDDVPDFPAVPKARMSPVVGRVQTIPVEDSLSRGEALVASETLEYPRKAPKQASKQGSAKAEARAPVMRRPRIEVEVRRIGPDDRLKQAVVSAIAREPNLSGQIAVEARDAVVRLSGWTTTPGQSLRAEKAAARVDGVRHVLNEIRPRMGAITS